MPIVVNNNFSQDTYGIRTERLIAIQGNFALIQPELSASAHISNWEDDTTPINKSTNGLSRGLIVDTKYSRRK